jgi:long-subunit fatty acid transport protein
MIQYSPRFQLQKTESYNSEGQLESTINPFELTSDYAHTGLGAKYQVTKNLNLEASYTYFFTSMNGGAGSTYNLGIRIIL